MGLADDGVEGVAGTSGGGAVTTWRFDHLGVVVEKIEAGRAFLTEAMGVTRWSAVFADEGIGVVVQFGRGETGPTFEVVAPLGGASPVRGALRGGKNVLQHVAYLTGDLGMEGARLRAMGCQATGDPRPAAAYAGRPVQFWISPLRFMIELVEAPEHEHVLLPEAV